MSARAAMVENANDAPRVHPATEVHPGR